MKKLSIDSRYLSTSNFWVNLLGGLFFIATLIMLNLLDVKENFLLIFFLPALIGFIPILISEVFYLNSYKKSDLFTDPAKRDYKRINLKFTGIIISFLFLFVFHSLIPEYKKEEYEPFFISFYIVSIVFILLSYVYIWFLDPRSKNPYDDLWHFSKFFTYGRKGDMDIDLDKVRKYSAGLLLKSFFIPCMGLFYMPYTFLAVTDPDAYMNNFLKDVPEVQILTIIFYIYMLIATIDMFYGITGYIFTLKVLNSHIRSIEKTVTGWLVCLICYFPFFEILLLIPILSNFFNGTNWTFWFNNNSQTIIFWGILVISGQFLEVLGTVSFGIRFSNLAYRGLIINGLFRYMKHPQYTGKMLNRFFFYVPFLSTAGVWGVFEGFCAFFILCFIYYLRAKTEENHLSKHHPEYVTYALWMNENGLFNWFTKKMPFLAYSEKKAKAGKIF